MTQLAEEKEGNPYNLKKSWHNVKEKSFLDSDNVYYDEVKENIEEIEEQEEPKKITKNNSDQPYKKPDYKKRYDDLKTHYDKKLEEFKQKEDELLKQVQEQAPEYKAPKTAEELEKFKKSYPDVYEIVETVAHLQSEQKSKVLEERLAALQEREQKLVREDAEQRLKSKHPDFDDIRNSDDFHAWAEAQPKSIKDWIYNNAEDPDLAIRALDLYKKDNNIEPSKAKKSSSTQQSKKTAADMVSTKTTAVEPNQQKIWTEREIAALSMDEFDKYEEEISQAMIEGRIRR